MEKEGKKGDLKETIDISKASSDLEVFSPGSLEELDEEKRIKAHWFKEKVIVWLSVTVIITILTLSVGLVWFDDDQEARGWGFQTLATLLGFAAGAIWQTTQKK